ncbi:RluA family pseudouridine synthase [Candidatus Parcubacteria bacterium]|nr:RluA family pseudouridine synthase [Candidatus Parcubacteria bacterium]
MISLRVHTEDAGQRLDVFLAARSTYSRSQIQKLIKSDSVKVGGKKAKSNYRLEEGETVEVPELEESHPPVKQGNAPILPIVFENDDLLILNKPAGIIVHPSEGIQNEPTVVDALLERYPAMAEVGEDPARPGIVHRLDRDVSGLMVVAKTAQAFDALKRQFQERGLYKEYVALVYGAMPKDHGVIEMNIARSRARGRMVARPVSQEGKQAKTEYEVIERYKNYTLLKIILHTGRTHQIRVHLRAIDHPVVGDRLYKKTRMKNIRPMELPRLFLHATKLRLRLMDETERTFEEPLPEELKTILAKLKEAGRPFVI